MTKSWDATTLAAIDTADDLKISPLRDDNVTHGTPTWIWCVVLDGELYVRPYYGSRSRWYAAALARPEGRIHAAGAVYEVTYQPADPALADQIDAAYTRKYAPSPYLPAMLAPSPRECAIRLALKES